MLQTILSYLTRNKRHENNLFTRVFYTFRHLKRRVYIYDKTYYLHRLIAQTFLSNPEKKEQVNHKDGKKLNNAVDNLEWVTNQENQIHKFLNGLGNNFTRKIVQYDLEMNEIKRFPSIVEASRILHVGKSNILGVLTNYRKTAGGFIFKYEELANDLNRLSLKIEKEK